MKLKRGFAIFRKELIHIKRDPISLIQILLMPIMLLLLYGFALTFDIKNIPFAVIDYDGSQISTKFIEYCTANRLFKLSHKLTSYNQAYYFINTGEIRLALIIPFHFSRTIKKGEIAKVQIIVDGVDANTANIALGYIQAIVNSYNEKLVINYIQPIKTNKIMTLLSLNPRIWYNEEMKSKNFIIPGLTVVIMTMVGALLTALCVVREKERGSLESLIATPIQRSELLLGKLGSYLLIGIIDIVIIMCVGQYFFQIPMYGNWFLMISISSLYLLVMLGQGILISVVANNQLQANQLAMLTTFLPALLLSGFMFDLRLMPIPLQIISYIIPAKYFVKIIKDIYLKGLGFSFFWRETVLLIIFALLFLFLATQHFKKKI